MSNPGALAKPRSALAFAPAAADLPQELAAAHALPQGAVLSCVTAAADFAALEQDWRRLEASAAAPHNIFQSFDWLLCWSKVYGAAPCVVTGYQDGAMVFAWPLMKERLGPLIVLRWMSEPLSQYGDVLVAPGQCARIWMERATALLRQQRAFDVIRLRHVRSDAAAAAFLDLHFRDSRMAEQAPWLDLTQFADEAAYDARYTSTQRKRRKKIRKSLEDGFGPLAFELLAAGPASDRAIAEAVTEKCRWLGSRGRHNRVLCHDRLVAFLQLLSRCANTAQLVTSRLAAGGRPISWELGLRYRGGHFGFITAHDTALTDQSPARLHMDLSQRQALRDGLHSFDLMVPNDAHKESWSSAKVTTRDYHLPLSALGRLYGTGYLETARPLVRRAYYRMPPGLLRLLKPLTGH